MIRLLKDQAFVPGKNYIEAAGLSTDQKPTTGIVTGSRFLEVNTGAIYEFDEVGGTWAKVEDFGGDIAAAVDAWLDAHPEATTTVEDGAISYAKLDSGLKATADEVPELKSALDMIYNATWLFKENQAAQVYPYTFTAGTTYIAKNFTTGINVNLRTCTSDGTEIELIKNGITPGEYVFFTPTQNASYVRLYATGQNTNVIIGTYGELFNRYGEIDLLEKGIGIKWINGIYISSNGSLASATDRACTGYIPCEPLATMTYVGECNSSNICAVAFFDSKYAFLSGQINQGANLGDICTCTVPEGAAYFRLTTKISILQKSYYEFGEKSTELMYLAKKSDHNRIVYVNGSTGNDSNDGTKPRPFKTISRALKENAYNVCVYPGTYSETLEFDYKEYHIYAESVSYSSDALTRPKVVLDGGNSLTRGIKSFYSNNVVLEDIVFQNYTENGAYILYAGNLKVKGCEFLNNGANGLRLDYVNGIIEDSVANYNSSDGFNMNYYGATQFINCSGHHNGDDGISHHQGCTGVINGGEWHHNTKGGVSSPCYGAQVDILNVYSHDNAYGLYSDSSNADQKRKFRVWNCVFTNNNQYALRSTYNDAVCFGCKISGEILDTNGSVTILD